MEEKEYRRTRKLLGVYGVGRGFIFAYLIITSLACAGMIFEFFNIDVGLIVFWLFSLSFGYTTPALGIAFAVDMLHKSAAAGGMILLLSLASVAALFILWKISGRRIWAAIVLAVLFALDLFSLKIIRNPIVLEIVRIPVILHVFAAIPPFVAGIVGSILKKRCPPGKIPTLGEWDKIWNDNQCACVSNGREYIASKRRGEWQSENAERGKERAESPGKSFEGETGRYKEERNTESVNGGEKTTGAIREKILKEKEEKTKNSESREGGENRAERKE
jgi:membrane protein